MTYKDKIKVLCKRYRINARDASERIKYDKYMRQARTLTEFNSCLDDLFRILPE